MKVLVTGGTGFIGRKLTTALAEAGNSVTSVSRNEGTDVTKWGDVQKLGSADIVFHLAGSLGRGVEPREHYHANWVGTLNLLEYSRVHKVRLFVFASSYVYGIPEYLPVDENHPIGGKGAYATSKILSEDLCRGYSEEFGLPVLALRLFNPYGPFQCGNLLIPTLLSQLSLGKEAVLKDPKPKRDFVFIDDVVEAFVLASQHTLSGFHAFNIATGTSISVEELVEAIREAWGSPTSVRFTGEERAHEIMDCPGSADLISQQLGWQPRVVFNEGICRTVEWWKNR